LRLLDEAVRASWCALLKEAQQEAIRAGYAATIAALDAIKKRATGGIDWVALRHAD
jgi:hypothetical protein